MYWLIAILAVVVLLPIVGLAALSIFSPPAKGIGVKDGQLADCPKSPNCVCTHGGDAEHAMDPIPFDGSADDAMRRLEAALAAMPRMKFVTKNDNYIHAEATTALFRFVDDVQILIDSKQHVIHFRSASRAGHSDLGANRKRMETFRAEFEKTKL